MTRAVLAVDVPLARPYSPPHRKRLVRVRLFGRKHCADVCPTGVRTFERAFPAHIGHLKPVFTVLSPRELDQAAELLQKLRDALREAHAGRKAA